MLRIIFVTCSLLLTLSLSYPTFYQPYQTYAYPGYLSSYPTQVIQNPYMTINNIPSQAIQIPCKTTNFIPSPATYQTLRTSSNIAQVTRQQTDALKVTLSQLSANPTASKYIEEIFSAGTCVKSLEEAITAIETGAVLIENSEPELTKLSASLNGISATTDISAATRASAGILLQMETLLPKLTPKYTTCGSTSEATYESLTSVGEVLALVSSDASIYLSPVTRQELLRSKQIVDSVTSLMKQLKTTFRDLNLGCSSDKGYNLRALSSLAGMLDQLAQLFASLGAGAQANTIRQNTLFTQKIAAAIQSTDSSKLGNVECNRPGDFSVVAQTLEDIADLIDEVGIDSLKSQLGLSELF